MVVEVDDRGRPALRLVRLVEADMPDHLASLAEADRLHRGITDSKTLRPGHSSPTNSALAAMEGPEVVNQAPAAPHAAPRYARWTTSA